MARRGEVRPAVKERAVHLVEALGSWHRAGGSGLTAARSRVAGLGLTAALADQMRALLADGDAAVVQVVDAQYGGILPTAASVLVVVDQWRLLADGTVVPGGTTFDVRLVAASPRWRVTEVLPARPGPHVASLTPAARQVLADHRLRLPHAARSDVLAGRIHDSVLTALTALARRYVVDVSVLRSGHPLYVFGTNRLSDHPKGRAADVWALDHRPLVVPANLDLAVSAMRIAAANGSYNIGGPVLLPGPQFFHDATHDDHVHMGFLS